LNALNAFLQEARYESLRTLRMPGFAIPFLLLPVALYLFFGLVLAGNAKSAGVSPAHLALFTLTGFSVFGVMGPGIFGFGIFVASEREQGLLALKRALPMPPAAYLLAKMSMAMLFAAIVMLTMLGATILTKANLGVSQVLSLASIGILGALPFCALGLVIGTSCSAKAAPAFVNLAYLPMIYLSNMLFPLPPALQSIARVSPAYHLNQLLLNAVGVPTQGSVFAHVAVLLGVTLVLTWLAGRRLARAG
jgi:ABC-2 type transport system permease protein